MTVKQHDDTQEIESTITALLPQFIRRNVVSEVKAKKDLVWLPTIQNNRKAINRTWKEIKGVSFLPKQLVKKNVKKVKEANDFLRF